jgi:hypothetical protein
MESFRCRSKGKHETQVADQFSCAVVQFATDANRICVAMGHLIYLHWFCFLVLILTTVYTFQPRFLGRSSLHIMDNISNPRPLSFLLQILLLSFLTLQLPTPCLAQDSTSSEATVATADARRPDSTTSSSLQLSSTSSAVAQTHTVQVGLADHKFRPDVTEAEVGDVSLPLPIHSFRKISR